MIARSWEFKSPYRYHFKINTCMRIDELTRLGYRVVAHQDGQLVSLYGSHKVSDKVGTIVRPGGKGLYLGTLKEFALNYYSGMSDYPDALLTYSYSINDLLEGDPDTGITHPPHDGGEIVVRQAKLVSVEYLPQD